ncbi:hypothetical protein PybrP1_000393 [[Pythium] brassicae (nom. inval.)]|nr:hypothetical protein PybrP1_000393 [[Pythium] brassicae (nom. inval.)]
MPEEPVVVALRRKVRSLETNLLEWRRCACTFTRDARLVLELSDDDVDDVELDGGASDGGSDDASRRLRGKCRVVIDLASQLRRIEQKRKSKTRCELEYHLGPGGRQSGRQAVRTEELMASSAKHCKQFVDQVRAAEQQGKRAESIRLGSLLAANAAVGANGFPVSAVSRSASSVSQSSSGATTRVAVGRSGGSQISSPKSDTLDSSSGATSPRVLGDELKTSNFTSRVNKFAGSNNRALGLSQLSSHDSSSSSTTTNRILLSATPLPQELFAQRLASIRATGIDTRHFSNSAARADCDDDDDDDDEGFDVRRKARMDRMLITTAPTPGLVASLHRLRADQDDTDDSSNRAELHILMRVEAALRQLEKENALAKEREHALSQEVQALRDALRVKSAETKHVESQFHQLLRETDEWKQAAQRAGRSAAQLENELLIAREEAQLLHSEKLRLKHQNKELLTHVHRLDSLVYGRF